MATSETHDLLLSALRGDLPAYAGGGAALSADQWQALAELANDYQLAPLLYSEIRDLPQGALPPDVETRLKHAHRLTAAANMRLYHELRGMLRTMANRSIPTIVLKGAYLAQVAYEHAALRPMRDIDLMVPRSRLPEALECLESMGYGGASADEALARCATAAHAAPLVKAGAPAVEMHWSIEGPRSPFAVDVDGLWHRARGVKIAGADALVLSHEDFLLHLCLHGTRHLTRDWQDRTVLKSVCDIAHAVATWANATDWQVVRRRALEWRARNAVFVMLYLAKEWLAAPVPEEFLSSLRPADLTSDLLTWTRERILRSGIAVAEPVGDNVAQFVQASGIRAKAALIFREAFPTRDQMAVRYGVSARTPRIYFRYAAHVAGLVVRGVTQGWGLLTGRVVPDDSARVVAHNVALRTWLQSPRN